MERLGRRYESEVGRITAKLQENTSQLNFTIDVWSCGGIAFVGLTVQYINKSWEMEAFPLDFSECHQGGHNGEFLAESFVNSLATYNISPLKILCIVSDNASANVAMERKLQTLIPENIRDRRVGCYAHVLNLACQDFLSSVSDTILTIREVVTKIKDSPKRSSFFKSICASKKLPPLKLMLDCRTRWNSTLAMITRCIKLRDALEELTQTHVDFSQYAISTAQWKYLEKVVELLSPFEDLTAYLSGQKYITITLVYPMLQKLILYFKNTKVSYVSIKEGMEAGIMKVQKYLDIMNPLVKLATILDPRVNISIFVGTEDETEVKKVFFEVYGQYCALYPHLAQTPQLKKNFCSLSPAKEGEVEAYFKQNCDEKIDPLVWWKLNEKVYPILAQMAKDFLSIPASSVASERLFSSAGIVFNDLRRRLNPKQLKSILCLKGWWLLESSTLEEDSE